MEPKLNKVFIELKSYYTEIHKGNPKNHEDDDFLCATPCLPDCTGGSSPCNSVK